MESWSERGDRAPVSRLQPAHARRSVMLQGKVIEVVMPAYHAAYTLEKTVADNP
jgi:hypothetical protein